MRKRIKEVALILWCITIIIIGCLTIPIWLIVYVITGWKLNEYIDDQCASISDNQ